MDSTEGWDALGNYSLFFPDDTFNLFGDFDLDLGYNDFLVPPLDEAITTFDLAEWNQSEAMVPALPDVNFIPSTCGEPHDLITNQVAQLQASKDTSTSSPGSDRSPTSENQTSPDGYPAHGIEGEHQLKTVARRRNFLTAFSAESGEEIRLHTRKRFSKERRKVVAFNRIIGVCLHCRLRKVSVSSRHKFNYHLRLIVSV
jgi:hypothetical protein